MGSVRLKAIGFIFLVALAAALIGINHLILGTVVQFGGNALVLAFFSVLGSLLLKKERSNRNIITRSGEHLFRVQSEPGKGSVFSFKIPATIPSSGSVGVESRHDRIIGVAPGQPRYRLLIVEDQPINRMLLCKILEPLDFELRAANNGQMALMHFKQWQPHLIWMDILMPVMDGLETTRRIKATKAGRHTKIIALTAHALEEERTEILAAGCDDFIRKPYQVTEIFECLTKHLGVRYITAT